MRVVQLAFAALAGFLAISDIMPVMGTASPAEPASSGPPNSTLSQHSHFLALRGVAPGTATCGITPEGSKWCAGAGSQAVKYLYALTVGAPWADGEGCNGIMDTLQHFVEYGSYFRTVNCASAQGGAATDLAFSTNAGQGERVNRALGTLYPGAGGGFHCGPDPEGPVCDPLPTWAGRVCKGVWGDMALVWRRG